MSQAYARMCNFSTRTILFLEIACDFWRVYSRFSVNVYASGTVLLQNVKYFFNQKLYNFGLTHFVDVIW